MIPENEMGVIAYFFSECDKNDWKLHSIGTAFPDATIFYKGKKLKVEFEFKCSNFVRHGHDVKNCDLVICWVNDLEYFPLPVLELRQGFEFTMFTPSEYELELGHWKVRAVVAESSLKLLRNVVADDPKINDLNLLEREEHNGEKIKEFLKRKGSCKVSEIASLLSITKPTAQRILRDMVAREELVEEIIGNTFVFYSPDSYLYAVTETFNTEAL